MQKQSQTADLGAPDSVRHQKLDWYIFVMIMALFVQKLEKIWIIPSSSEAILTFILILTQAYQLGKFSLDCTLRSILMIVNLKKKFSNVL